MLEELTGTEIDAVNPGVVNKRKAAQHRKRRVNFDISVVFSFKNEGTIYTVNDVKNQ